MPLGRPLSPLTLLPAERQSLLDWTRRPKTAQALALRARIVLLCAAGLSNSEVARRLHVTGATVGKWRQRFVPLRLDGLPDEPRPGTTRRLSDAAVERVLARTLETQPQAATHWSTRSLAQASGLSQSSISRIWRAFSLQSLHSPNPAKKPQGVLPDHSTGARGCLARPIRLFWLKWGSARPNHLVMPTEAGAPATASGGTCCFPATRTSAQLTRTTRKKDAPPVVRDGWVAILMVSGDFAPAHPSKSAGRGTLS
jgi:transposase